MNAAGPPLSTLVTDVVAIFFHGEERSAVTAVLLHECGFDLPLATSTVLVERIRLAVLKLADGHADALRDDVKAARVDWRDVLVAADFGNDVTAHVKWANKLLADGLSRR
jgi:hypothetical protein